MVEDIQASETVGMGSSLMFGKLQEEGTYTCKAFSNYSRSLSTPQSVAQAPNDPNWLASQLCFYTETQEVPVQTQTQIDSYDGIVRLNGGIRYSLPIIMLDKCISQGFIKDQNKIQEKIAYRQIANFFQRAASKSSIFSL